MATDPQRSTGKSETDEFWRDHLKNTKNTGFIVFTLFQVLVDPWVFDWKAATLNQWGRRFESTAPTKETNHL